MLLLAGVAAGQIAPVPSGQGRYLVELSTEAAAVDARTLVSELAATYGGTVEPRSQAGRFVIDILPARAEMLGRDARVTRIAEAAPADQRRPRAVPNGNGNMSWAYSYDGAGNIVAAGSDSYAYDTANRLIRATVGGASNTMAYQYDALGNRTVATPGVSAAKCVGGTDCDMPVTVSTSTNHLTDPIANAITYDPAGNLTALSAVNSFTYDALSMVQSSHLGSNTLQYIYTADDERVAAYSGGLWTWTIRDIGAHPLREYTSNDAGSSYGTANLTWSRDSIWRGGQLLASEARRSASDATVVTEHFHLDQLGTPRLVTDNAGVKLATHTYYPFGGELDSTTWEQPEAQLKFTSHMRDTGRNGGLSLDDMHARYYSANLGRFSSVDPALDLKKTLPTPQMWNRYAYVINNPLRLIDPAGRADDDPNCSGCNDVVGPVSIFGVHSTPAFHQDDLIGQANEALSRQMQAAALKSATFFAKFAAHYSMVFIAPLEEPVVGTVTEETMSGALAANKLTHIFGKEKHGLDILVNLFGSESAATAEVVSALGKAGAVTASENGLFASLINVGGQVIRVTGAIVKGVVKIGTFYLIR
jgi:RHS repeat-associated protein